jgi:uncharacterized membrane protein YjjP (DUF1212 family)/uncharacterized membrane protein YjjB (DUF3815 family)
MRKAIMTNQNTPVGANENEVLDFLCQLSQQLLDWSWEGVAGYEEIVERVGRTYGYENTTVNMEAQLATIKIGELSTFVKGGIPGFPPMAHTQNLKDLLADIFDGKLTVSEASKALKDIHDLKPPYSPLMVWLGVIIISIGFAVDVVGTWEGMFWAGITGIATGLAFIAADKVPGFGKIVPLVATLVSGVIVMLAWKFGWTAAAPGLLLISATFVFIPGDSISTQAYELAEGKWSAGVDRLFYSVIMLVLQVTGALIAVALTNISIDELFPKGPHESFPWWAAYPGRFVFMIGILLTFQMTKKHFITALLTLWLVTAVAQLSSMGYGELAGTFIAMVAGTVLAIILASKPKSIPAFVLLVPIIFALSPGSHGLRQLETWASGETITGVQDLTTLVSTLLAIGIGLVVGRAIAHRWRWINNQMKF